MVGGDKFNCRERDVGSAHACGVGSSRGKCSDRGPNATLMAGVQSALRSDCGLPAPSCWRAVPPAAGGACRAGMEESRAWRGTGARMAGESRRLPNRQPGRCQIQLAGAKYNWQEAAAAGSSGTRGSGKGQDGEHIPIPDKRCPLTSRVWHKLQAEGAPEHVAGASSAGTAEVGSGGVTRTAAAEQPLAVDEGVGADEHRTRSAQIVQVCLAIPKGDRISVAGRQDNLWSSGGPSVGPALQFGLGTPRQLRAGGVRGRRGAA